MMTRSVHHRSVPRCDVVISDRRTVREHSQPAPGLNVRCTAQTSYSLVNWRVHSESARISRYAFEAAAGPPFVSKTAIHLVSLFPTEEDHVHTVLPSVAGAASLGALTVPCTSSMPQSKANFASCTSHPQLPRICAPASVLADPSDPDKATPQALPIAAMVITYALLHACVHSAPNRVQTANQVLHCCQF